MTVVAAVIVPQAAWRKLEDYRQRIIRHYIDQDLQEGFIFHAKDITGGDKKPFRDWGGERRWQFVKDMISGPPELGFSVAIGVAYAKRDPSTGKKENKELAAQRHIAAHEFALTFADKYVDKAYDQSETATVIAEDSHEMRRRLRVLHSQMLAQKTKVSRIAGGIKRTVGTINFAEKEGEPLLQFADAYAFAFRRFLSGHKYSEELVHAMVTGDREGPIEQLRQRHEDRQSCGYTLINHFSGSDESTRFLNSLDKGW